MINNVNNFLEIANSNKKNNGLTDEYCALISMIRVIDNKLYVVVPFVKNDEKVWNKHNNIIPEYWALIDPIDMKLKEFNKTIDKSFLNGSIIRNTSDDSFNKEVSKYIVSTKLKYKKQIKNDVMNNDLLTYQNKLKELVGDLNINEEKVSFNDYFYVNFEDEINNKIDELVDLIASVKYNSLTTYYDILFANIIDEYIENKNINRDKIIFACDMMNTYYPGIDGINNIFNYNIIIYEKIVFLKKHNIVLLDVLKIQYQLP